mmetsp:Transcript_19740/g.41493  ORF Transcript_19740/g.41493 Transcript_19740/m.41493 type:complete len:276 (-) Transcript_19740:180-1007(-)
MLDGTHVPRPIPHAQRPTPLVVGHSQYQGVDSETGVDSKLYGATVDKNHSDAYNFKTFGGGNIKECRGEGVTTTTDRYKDRMISDAKKTIMNIVETQWLNQGLVDKAVELFATYRWAEERVQGFDQIVASCVLLASAVHTEAQRAPPNARVERIARLKAGVDERTRLAQLGVSGGGSFKSKRRCGESIVRSRNGHLAALLSRQPRATTRRHDSTAAAQSSSQMVVLGFRHGSDGGGGGSGGLGAIELEVAGVTDTASEVSDADFEMLTNSLFDGF